MKALTALLAVLLVASCATNKVKVVNQTGGGGKTTSGVELKLVKMIPPAYPPEARKAGLKGVARVALTVQPDGSVSDLKVVQSAHPTLDQFALQAVSQWKFKPYTPVDGKLERVSFPFTFMLN
ncbi:energy transducer TonB [Brevifollis gellanilyticus]|nr:energy transducer TonB [Brevifollis gellanilyticus]